MTMGVEELAAIVGRTVKLTKRGNSWWGLCPNHNDRRASLHVFRAKDGRGRYHCFVCGREFSGDGIAWLQLVEHKSFKEAGGTSLGQEIRKELEAKKRRERKLDELYDRQPECVIPDWGIDT